MHLIIDSVGVVLGVSLVPSVTLGVDPVVGLVRSVDVGVGIVVVGPIQMKRYGVLLQTYINA